MASLPYLDCLTKRAIDDLEESANIYPKAVIARAECVQHLAEIRDNGRSAPFSEQFFRTIYLWATDPRDQVYGLLGFSSFRKRPIVADYTRTTKQVYEEAVTVIMQEDFCSYVDSQLWRHSRMYDVVSGEPESWIPDLRAIGLDQRPPPSTIAPQRLDLMNILTKSHPDAPIIAVPSDFSRFYTAGTMLGKVSRS